MNNKGADQFAWMHRLVCAFGVPKTRRQTFSFRGSFYSLYQYIFTEMANYKAGLVSVMVHGIIPKGVKEMAQAQTSEHTKNKWTG